MPEFRRQPPPLQPYAQRVSYPTMPLFVKEEYSGSDAPATIVTNVSAKVTSKSAAFNKWKVSKVVMSFVAGLTPPAEASRDRPLDHRRLIEQVPTKGLHKKTGLSYKALAAKEIQDVDPAKRVAILEEYISVRRVPHKDTSGGLTVKEMLTIDPERRATIKRNVRKASEVARGKLGVDPGTRQQRVDALSPRRTRRLSGSKDMHMTMAPPLPVRSHLRRPATVYGTQISHAFANASLDLSSPPSLSDGASLASTVSCDSSPRQRSSKYDDSYFTISTRETATSEDDVSLFYYRPSSVRPLRLAGLPPERTNGFQSTIDTSISSHDAGHNEVIKPFINKKSEEEKARLDRFRQIFHRTHFKVQEDLQQRLPVEKRANISAQQMARDYLAQTQFVKTAGDRGWIVTDPSKEVMRGVIGAPMEDIDEEMLEYIWAVKFLEQCERKTEMAAMTLAYARSTSFVSRV